MQTKRLYSVAAVSRWDGALFQKLFVILLLIALLLASLPIKSVLAASGPMENSNLELEWKNKLDTLRAQGLFYERVRLNPADFENSDDLARAHYFLEKYGIALRQANTVVFNHTGFDIKGHLTHENQAYESVHDLAMYLQMMRGFREKLNEIPRQNRSRAR
jgi:hypothetical protein